MPKLPYITRLRQDNKALKDQLQNINDEITNFLTFLHSDKFTGFQSDGARKDWISTSDVIHKLRDFRLLIMQ